MYQGLIHRYRDYMPIAPEAKAITLHEGNTPLIKLSNIPAKLNLDAEIYVKYEGLNPTGSFKDRGMTIAVTHAVHEGSEAIICASTGNTSAAAAAYAARAGIRAFVLIPEGKIALGKLAQAMMHGASILQIQGNFDDGMEIVKHITEYAPVAIVNSINPYRLHGQKTAAFEVVEQLDGVPDYHAFPVGNAGNISAYWMGYSEFFDKNKIDRRPTLLGFQASGAAPIVDGKPCANPETVATAIRIGNPQSWEKATRAAEESNGWFDKLDDEEILATQKMLAQHEGIFCEPASAASLGGVLRDLQTGKLPTGKRIVCTLTGHGLKDPDVAIEQSRGQMQTIPATMDAVKDAILKQVD